MNKHALPLTAGKNNNLAGDVVKLMNDMLAWQPQIEKAMAHLDHPYTFNDVVASVLRQERHFYDFEDCCVIMQYEQYPQYSNYHCFIACGKMQAIKDAEPHINEVAKQLGCKHMSISGRIGWPRALKSDGWKHVISVLYKEVY